MPLTAGLMVHAPMTAAMDPTQLPEATSPGQTRSGGSTYGRNTHLIQRDQRWWTKQLRRFFVLGHVEQRGPELRIVVGKKSPKATPVPTAATVAAA